MSKELLQHGELAEAAGFKTIGDEARKLADRQRRLLLAYEHFRYVRQEKVKAFCDKLRKATSRMEGKFPNMFEVCDDLEFTPVEKYKTLPPSDVLEQVKAAKDRGIFDEMEVAKIKSTRVYRDPIVFGRIEGCTDRFFIAQWGDDVKIEDLLGPNEG